MKILIISNKSEIGYKMTVKLSEVHEIIFVSKNKRIADKLKENKNIKVINTDIASTYNCEKLYKKVGDEVDAVINYLDMVSPQRFTEEKIDNDLDLIDINVKSVHTLTKLFLTSFVKRDNGIIINTCFDNSNIKSFNVTYDASKSYLTSLTFAIKEELRRKKSNVKVHFLVLDDINNNNMILDKLYREEKSVLKGKN